MAKYRADTDDAVVRCPYCKYEYQPEAEDYSEESREIQCFGCEKKFWAHQSFSVAHHVEPDCELNGEQHQWDFVVGHHDWQSCGTCDKWRKAPTSDSASVTQEK